ncbi:MAG: hypothetical protein D8M51_14455 [Ignavibacteriae bacterium]|nr:hypothetical protein [Ignavibacteriota bacterium]
MVKAIAITGTTTHTVNFQYTADNERILKNEKQGTVNNNYVYVRGNNDYPITEKINTNNALADKIYIYGPTGLKFFLWSSRTLRDVYDFQTVSRYERDSLGIYLFPILEAEQMF